MLQYLMGIITQEIPLYFNKCTEPILITIYRDRQLYTIGVYQEQISFLEYHWAIRHNAIVLLYAK